MQFLDTLTGGHETLLHPLGDYSSLPRAKLHWQYDKGSIFCSNHATTEHNVYVLQLGDRITKSGPVHERIGAVEDPVEGSHYATVASHVDNRVKPHHRVSKYVVGSSPESFLDTLRLFTNQHMWDVMYLDDEESG